MNHTWESAMYRISRTVQLLIAGLALLVCVAAASVGGFQLVVDLPPSTAVLDGTTGLASETVVIIRTFGCREPAKAKITATAEGIVGGKRQTVPVRLEEMSKGVYAVKRQWPREGAWALNVTGRYQQHTSSVLVELDREGAVVVNGYDEHIGGLAVQRVSRAFEGAEIEAALRQDTGR
jgi:hypothetical protein